VGVEDALEVGGVAGLGGMGLEQHWPVGGVEEVDAADRDRPDRVAVVGLAQLYEGGAPGAFGPPLGLVLEGHLQGDLRRGRAGVREEDPLEPGRGDRDQARRQLGREGMGEPEHGRVGDPPELPAHGAVDLRVTVTVDVAPEGGGAVEVAAAIDVDQVGALAALDQQRLFLGPALLLGEGVPEMVVVELRGVCRHRDRR
jgi:hypothetical protein